MSETEIEGGKFEIKFFLKQGTCCKLQFVITCLNVFSWCCLYVFACVQCLWCHGVPVLTSASGILSYMALKNQTLSSPALTGIVRWGVEIFTCSFRVNLTKKC